MNRQWRELMKGNIFRGNDKIPPFVIIGFVEILQWKLACRTSIAEVIRWSNDRPCESRHYTAIILNLICKEGRLFKLVIKATFHRQHLILHQQTWPVFIANPCWHLSSQNLIWYCYPAMAIIMIKMFLLKVVIKFFGNSLSWSLERVAWWGLQVIHLCTDICSHRDS